MEDILISNIARLQKKYQYDDTNLLGFDKISSTLSYKCYASMGDLIRKIKKIIANLKGYEGPKKNFVGENLMKMNLLLNYYEDLRNVILDEDVYYSILIGDIRANYLLKPNIKYMKNIFANLLKNILDSRVLTYINYEKYIIYLLDLIKQLNLFFGF